MQAHEAGAGRRAEDEKRQRVLDGAVKVFLAYGFQRTTMDDIARAADMSRPALYLLFRNKTDIYRALAQACLDEAAATASARLAGTGALEERLASAVGDSLLALLESFAEAPHGHEILDMKNSLAGDLIASWLGEVTALFARAIAEEAAFAGVDLAARGLDAEGLAVHFWDSVEGAKVRSADPAACRRALRTAAALVAGAVRR